MTKKEIAKQLNISRVHLYELLRGEQSCSEDMLNKLKKHFKLDYIETKREIRYKISSYKENKE